MNMYEFTFLLEDSKSLKKLEEILGVYKGKKIKETALGKRVLAYPINKKIAAEYFVWQIQMATDKIKDFKQKLNFENIVMRYLLLNTI